MPSARKRNTRSPKPAPPAADARGARGLSRASLAGAIVLGAAAAVWFALHRPAAVDLHAIPNQNVLLVTIDTLRADALSCYGGPARTPALDRLAAEGVRFDFAHAQSVLTLPSHTSILTGEYPFQHGVRENSGYRVAAGAQTAAVRLKRAGYATAAFVSGFPLHSQFGLNVGFDVYDDRFGETRAPTEFVMPERPASVVVPLAREWIRTRESGVGSRESDRAANPGSRVPNPWFLWLHLFDPHAPYKPPAPFDTEYAGRPYYGEVAAADAALAPLLDDVRASGRPTLVVVTGDHGESLGEHGEETHGIFAYEATLHVPLIIAELGGDRRLEDSARGEVSHASVRHVDILPTILDAIGQAVPRDLPGRSLLAASARRASTPVTSYFEAMSGMLNRGWAPLAGVLVDREKYIDLPIPERYDLAADPRETTNLAGRSPERDRTLAADLQAFQAPLPGERRTETPETAAALRALGYVSGGAPVKAHYTEADDPKRLVTIDQDIHRAVDLFGRGRLDEAAAIYRQVLAARPDMAIAYRHLAFVEWQRGDVRDAIAVLERAVQAGVRHTGVMTQLGSYLAESGHAAEAIQMLTPLAAAPDADADTLNSLGIAYARAGRADDARAVFEKVLAVNPASSIPLENLGILALERGDVDRARGLFERAVQADPRSSQAHADLGVVSLKRGDRETAITEWTRAVSLDPTNYDALYNLGIALRDAGRFDAARPYLERFARAAPPAFYARDIREVNAILQSQR